MLWAGIGAAVVEKQIPCEDDARARANATARKAGAFVTAHWIFVDFVRPRTYKSGT
jgi:hypothetical protein